jgi:hypothetical protein
MNDNMCSELQIVFESIIRTLMCVMESPWLLPGNGELQRRVAMGLTESKLKKTAKEMEETLTEDEDRFPFAASFHQVTESNSSCSKNVLLAADNFRKAISLFSQSTRRRKTSERGEFFEALPPVIKAMQLAVDTAIALIDIDSVFS